MSNLKRIFWAVFVLLVVLVVLAFVLENRQLVPLSFLGWSGPQLPVSMIAIVALLVGMLIGPLLSWLVGRMTRASRKQSG
ncbi:hypothetical protein BK653_05085 [Pseudomonas brassicacearum]|uniref:LapA family protein n=1 Tax=Pseudomonas brassicacearum TaxID=930166 RepID=UPI000F48AC99|nr:LapA family protein [Pseudomonas brassicacearum]ROM71259.1 hypothetical protein BK653_05085 [Pseudomonas brassicacearum]